MGSRIVVIGAGYLGTTHAACLAELGFEVLGVDIDPQRVEQLRRGEVPFYEPGLSELVQTHASTGRLRFTTSYAEAAEFGQVFFLCVGTPQQRDGLGADVAQLFHAVELLVPRLRHPALLVGKSTVPVGTARALEVVAEGLAPAQARVRVAWNPEFLREGHAVQDTLRPERLVFGVSSVAAEDTLREVYAALLADGVPVVVTDTATAELVKTAANAFLATKISFINMVAELCDATGADVRGVSLALGLDSRIGPRFLSAGLGYGGGCLPKDVRGLIARAAELGVEPVQTFLHQVDAINRRARDRVVDAAIEQCGGCVAGRRVAVLGASFKPFTDDVRDSPALDVAIRLQQRGADVRVYDPQAGSTAARAFPALEYAGSAREAVQGAEVVLHLTDWPEFAELDPVELVGSVTPGCLIDARNTLDADRWRAAGWSYRAPGRGMRRGQSSQAVQGHATAS